MVVAASFVMVRATAKLVTPAVVVVTVVLWPAVDTVIGLGLVLTVTVLSVKNKILYNYIDVAGCDTALYLLVAIMYAAIIMLNKNSYLGCKKGEANQKQQLSDCGY